MPIVHESLEAHRLSSLRELEILDTPAEACYDRLTALAAEITGAPVALLTLLDEERQWFKASYGTDLTCTDRDAAFCNYTVEQADVLTVTDAQQDARFRNNPLVTGEPGIRAYCGAPVTLSNGARVGSLCVLDFQPRVFDDRSQAAIQRLADTASELLQSREQANQLANTQHQLRRLFDTTIEGVLSLEPVLNEEANIEDFVCLASNVAADRLLNGQQNIPAGSRLATDIGCDNDLSEKLSEALTDGRPTTFHYSPKRGDETRHWLLSVCPDAAQLTVTITDITEQHRKTLALRQSRDYLDHFIQNTPTLIVGISPDGHTTFVNPAVSQMTGYGKTELEGCHWWTTFYPDELWPQVDELFSELRQNGAVRNWEMVLSIKSGQRRRVSWTSINRYDDNGELIEVVGIGVDVTERAEYEAALRASESYTRATLDALPQHIAIIDSEGTIEAVNEAWRQYGAENGATHHSSIGFNYLDICEYSIGPCSGQAAEIAQGIRDVLHGERQRFSSEYPCHGPTKYQWFELQVTPFPDNGARRAVIAHHDITERKLAEQRLAENEERYALTIQGSQNGIWDWNLETNTIYFSASWRQILGCDETTLSQSPDEFFCRITSEYAETFRHQLQSHIEGQTETLDLELRMRRDNGAYVWVLCRGVAVRDRTGKAIRLAGSIANITELKDTQQRLQWIATHDVLTELANRPLLVDEIQQRLDERQKEDHHPFALLTLDFDRFKIVNDTLGHQVGDELLCMMAERITQELRDEDLAARFGGDEFAVLLNSIRDEDEACRVADALVQSLAQPYHLHGQHIVTSASIGVTVPEAEETSAERLLRNADAAMYQAKDSGKNTYRYFDIALHNATIREVELERALWQDFETDQFYLQYHSIVSGDEGDVVGFEALARWEHPEYGDIPPDQFVHIAENTGSIIPLGYWILRTGCAQLKGIRDYRPGERDPFMSMNISKRQLVDPCFASNVLEVICDADVPFEAIVLEVTETSVVEEYDEVVKPLQELRRAGIKIALDDFGTGRSSLGSLHNLPIDLLKVDKTFVWNLDSGYGHSAILFAIVELAHTLGLTVVAEGVENEGHLAQLLGMDVGLMQGFHFAKPIGAQQTFSEIENTYARRDSVEAT
jgi:diguanylate cyclase (GGDEF)-like protein/PAS domain S-box-containing protein